MKRSFLLVLILASAIFAQQSAPAASDVRPDSGSIVGDSYANDFFHFTYKLPVQWSGRAIQKSLPGQSQRFYQLLNALPANAGASIQYMGLQAEEVSAANSSARQFLAASPIFAPTSSYQSLGPVSDVQISGHTFARADFKSKPTQDDLGLTMFQSQLVTIIDKYALTLSFTADDKAALDQLVLSASTVAFAAPTAAPVVMATAPAPKPVVIKPSKPEVTGATIEMTIVDDSPAPASAPAVAANKTPQPVMVATTTTSPAATMQPAVVTTTTAPPPAPMMTTPAPAQSSPVLTTSTSSKPAKPSAGILAEPQPAAQTLPQPINVATNTTPPVSQPIATQPAPVQVASATTSPAPPPTSAAPKGDSSMTVTDADPGPSVAVSGVTRLGEDRVRLSEAALSDYIFSRSALTYPQAAKNLNIEGKVVIGIVVSMDGHIKSVKLVSGPPQLASAAMDSVHNWRFIPYLDGGRPMEVESQVSINFTLKH